MKRCSKIICPRVNLSLEFDKNLNHWCMSLTCCQMQRRKSIRVSAVDDLKHLILLVELLLGITQDLVDLVGVALVNFGPVVHFDFLDVLFSLLLLGWLLGQLGGCHIRLALGHCSLVSRVLLSVATTVASKFIRLIVIVVSKVNLLSVCPVWWLLLFLYSKLWLALQSCFVLDRAWSCTVFDCVALSCSITRCLIFYRTKLLTELVPFIANTHEVIFRAWVLGLSHSTRAISPHIHGGFNSKNLSLCTISCLFECVCCIRFYSKLRWILGSIIVDILGCISLRKKLFLVSASTSCCVCVILVCTWRAHRTICFGLQVVHQVVL